MPHTAPPSPLAGRVALVTGVSRRRGIGLAVATRLHRDGATVVATGWPAHDAEMPWAGDPADDPEALPFSIGRHDLADPGGPASLVDEVADHHGAIDMVVAVHARSSDLGLDEVTADELDRSWAVNVRAVVLLAQAFARRHDVDRPGGRMVWFTSGQHLEPMPDTVPYAVTKAALHEMTPTIAAALAPAGIAAICVNPGPVDTGWARESLHADVARRFPTGRWTGPDEIADVVAFLAGDAGAALTGQALDVEHGFRLGVRGDSDPR